jgi:hypothetical protein
LRTNAQAASLVGLISASLEPVFEIDEGGGSLIVVGTMEGILVERLDTVRVVVATMVVPVA